MPSSSDKGRFQDLGRYHTGAEKLTFTENAVGQYQLQNSRTHSSFRGGVGCGILFLRDLE